MILDLALVLTWLAAGYRLWVLLTRPRAIWRTSFSISMAATAVAFSLYRFRLPLDELTGLWNLAGLLSHAAFAAGVGFLLIYLDALRMPVVAIRRVRMYMITAGAAVLIMTVTWIVAPVHDRPRDDLLPLAGNLSVVFYCVAFWLYLAYALVQMAWTCLARGRTFRREDVARSISLLLIGVSAFAAVPVLLVWTTSIMLRYVTGAEASTLNAIGDAAMPWPVLVNAVGVLSLLTVPYLSALTTAWWRWRQLKPLWLALIRRYPEVHLDLHPSGGLVARTETRVERAIIEIHDALRIARVDDLDVGGRDTSLNAVAAALRRPGSGDRCAADLLERVDTRVDDVRQVVALGRAYRTAARTAAP